MNDNVMFRAATLTGVSFPNRIIELIVMPYETETTIRERGKVFTEIVSRGAFHGIEARNGGRVRVNRDHDVTRTVGRAVAFDPAREDGLLAELRIANTTLGEETLTLADEGILDASAGFSLMRDKQGKVVPGAMVWESQARCRLNHLFLAHVALTPDPAYETANVLAVRQTGAPVVTPNRDRLDVQRWRERLAVIDARYSRL